MFIFVFCHHGVIGITTFHFPQRTSLPLWSTSPCAANVSAAFCYWCHWSFGICSESYSSFRRIFDVFLFLLERHLDELFWSQNRKLPTTVDSDLYTSIKGGFWSFQRSFDCWAQVKSPWSRQYIRIQWRWELRGVWEPLGVSGKWMNIFYRRWCAFGAIAPLTMVTWGDMKKNMF